VTVSGLRVLVAGIGNVFLGDDAFGVEVVRRLQQGAGLADGVVVRDYGIRGFDLACDMLDDHDAVVLVDAVRRGEPPGTVVVVDASAGEQSHGDDSGHGVTGVEAHGLTPDAVLRLVASMGGHPARVFVVGCEPESFGEEMVGRMGLSMTVQAAIPAAETAVRQLVGDLLGARVTTAGVTED
jgi:hydrogenase maturation protease